jgi:small subunit ribosomal protein S3Ae
MAVAKKAADKWKMKQWYDVYAPKVISTEVIGSIPATEDKNVIGRIMKVNLSWITHNPNHAMAVIGLRMKSANGNVANTDVEYMALSFSYLHSLVKRRADVVYTYDIAKSKDGNAIKLKLLVTTRVRIAKKTKSDIRSAVHDFVMDYVLSMNKEDFVKAMINGDLQAEGMKKLLPIAPIAKFEIKKIEF